MLTYEAMASMIRTTFAGEIVFCYLFELFSFNGSKKVENSKPETRMTESCFNF